VADYLLIKGGRAIEIGLQDHQNLLKMPKYQQYIHATEIENAGLACCHDLNSQNDHGNHKMLLLEKIWL
jgi:hypothetical protein